MHLYDGPTGQAIREERNREINAPKPRKRPKFHKLHSCPNPGPRKLAIFKHRYSIA
jgi:hypothetical protein